MQRLEVSGAARPIYGSLGVKRLIKAGPRNTRRLRMDSQLNKIRRTSNRKNKMDRHVEIMGKRRDEYRDFVYKPEEERGIGIPRGTSEGNIKMDVK